MAIYKYKGWQLYDYFQWLVDKVDGHMPPWYDYSLLLKELHDIPFIWGIDMDKNRASDGERLRWEYMDENNIADIFYKDGIPCSVLEMMIGLSERCDTDIMGEAGEKHVSEWFWIMIENLDLLKCKDECFSSEYVLQQIGRWLDRDFRKNGFGSPFPRHKTRTDQRKVEIWQQMCGYLSENY